MFSGIEERLRNAKKIVVVTGAGISQESGIPTFRGKDGLWKKHDPMKLATIDAFYDDPKLVWEWYEDRRKNILSAKPNPGHTAIAELEKFAKVVILTQNIDGLHQTKLHPALKSPHTYTEAAVPQILMKFRLYNHKQYILF